MKGIILEDFFDFESHFLEFIKRTEVFNDVKKAQFFVYNEINTEIMYQYNYNCNLDVDIKELNKLSNDAIQIDRSDFVEFKCSEKNLFLDKGNVYLLNILDPGGLFNDKLGTLIVYCNEKICNNISINAHYLQQIINNIRLIISNYESVYLLIDIFTELIIRKDKYMPYHMTNVANLSVRIATYMELCPKQITILYFAALIHDIGKLYISDHIINKPEKLDEEEFEYIKNHPIKSAEIIKSALRGLLLLEEIPGVVKWHHENYDGTGYPDNLKGKEIPLLSRIIRVADSIDAMASKRAYKGEEEWKNIILELVKCSGKYYDPCVVDAAIQIILTHTQNVFEEKLDSTYFIPQASLSYKNCLNNKITPLYGNLIIKKKSGQFIIHDYEKVKNKCRIECIKKATICFFEQKELLEYTADIKENIEGTIFLDNIRLLPLDKTFYSKWDSETTLIDIYSGKIYNGKIIKLGTESCIMEFNLEDSNIIIQNIYNLFRLSFDEELDKYKVIMTLKIKIVNYYKNKTRSIFVCVFDNISPSEKDRILNLLFMNEKDIRRSINYISLNNGG